MGAGSSNVQKIKIDNTGISRTELDKKTPKKAPQTENVSEIEKPIKSNDQESPSKSEDAEMEALTKQLCESESLRMELEDQILHQYQLLAKQDADELTNQEKPCAATLNAKDQYIAKLEKENKELEMENKKIKIRHKKKVKQLSSQMLEYKQETKFQMMEMKEDLEKLKEENCRLKANPGSQQSESISVTDDGPKLPGGEKMKLILDLSEQVTEQSDKISKLERKLNEKDNVIDELRRKLKNSAGYITAVQEQQSNTQKKDHGEQKSNGIGSVIQNGGFGQTKQITVQSKDPLQPSVVTNHQNQSSVSGISSNISGQSSLFVLPEEDESEAESENMTKLSSFLQGVKADKKKKQSRLDSPTEESLVKEISELEDERADSRTGRDSGLGSAGNVEQRQARARWMSDWSSLENGSGLSDSDHDHESSSYQHSKISSAPPKLQNSGRNPRLKKKSSSLKNRAALKENDKPPKPSMAFAEGEREEIDKLLNMLPPVITPVDVSG